MSTELFIAVGIITLAALIFAGLPDWIDAAMRRMEAAKAARNRPAIDPRVKCQILRNNFGRSACAYYCRKLDDCEKRWTA
jgi:hypothetical protein